MARGIQVLQLLPLNSTAVSACLVGKKCRYDGRCSKNIDDLKMCLSICPEVLGGLGIPRIPCEIKRGDGFDVIAGKTSVIGSDAADYTHEFLNGAQKALKICLENGINTVILKERSPSCGVKNVYNDGVLIGGCGVTAALLIKNGLKVISDEDFIKGF